MIILKIMRLILIKMSPISFCRIKIIQIEELKDHLPMLLILYIFIFFFNY
jgi:hypothetical protein